MCVNRRTRRWLLSSALILVGLLFTPVESAAVVIPVEVDPSAICSLTDCGIDLPSATADVLGDRTVEPIEYRVTFAPDRQFIELGDAPEVFLAFVVSTTPDTGTTLVQDFDITLNLMDESGATVLTDVIFSENIDDESFSRNVRRLIPNADGVIFHGLDLVVIATTDPGDSGTLTFSPTPGEPRLSPAVNGVPEPTTVALVGFGFTLLALAKKRSSTATLPRSP